jgi:hypothetical protein
MQEYKFVVTGTPQALSERVTELLAQGWTLYGSPVAREGTAPASWGQALTRETGGGESIHEMRGVPSI